MIYIYCKQHSPRLTFIANHIFRHILGTDFVCTTDKDFFLVQTDLCINYSDEILNKGIQVIPQGLLSETGVHAMADLQKGQWKGLFCFFYQGEGVIPFDLFSASFYLLTLYEEHFSQEPDNHLRFEMKESLAYQEGFLEIPLIDRWAYLLKEALSESGCNTESFKLREYRAISTFDIDHPYLYKNKGFIKNLAGTFKDLKKCNWDGLRKRIRVLLHLQEDPYLEVLHWIESFHKKINQTYFLFILIARYGKYGRTTIYPLRKYFNYLRSLQKVSLGLHPSYHTFVNKKQTLAEKNKLECILGQEIKITRQHFLRMRNPETFQLLNECGFSEDFTLAFARSPGFRSGTSVPYYFYDISKEEETTLLIRPTVMMDSTLITHLNLSPSEAVQKMKMLANACKQSGGDYLMLWHNSNLAGEKNKNPWVDAFIESYTYALSLESNTFDGKFDQHESQ